MDYENPKAFTKPEQVTLPPQRRPNTQAMTPHIKMFVSDWFTDELGNKARIIKARDGSSSAPPAGLRPCPTLRQNAWRSRNERVAELRIAGGATG